MLMLTLAIMTRSGLPFDNTLGSLDRIQCYLHQMQMHDSVTSRRNESLTVNALENQQQRQESDTDVLYAHL